MMVGSRVRSREKKAQRSKTLLDRRPGGRRPTRSLVTRITIALLFGVLLVSLFGTGVAFGHTLTGPTVQWNQLGEWCSLNRPEIAHTRDARSWQRPFGSPCVSSTTAPTGSLQVRAHMFKDNVWCGATGWATNPWPVSSSSYFGVGSVLCSGSGTFYVGSNNARNIGGVWYYSSRVHGYAHQF